MRLLSGVDRICFFSKHFIQQFSSFDLLAFWHRMFNEDVRFFLLWILTHNEMGKWTRLILNSSFSILTHPIVDYFSFTPNNTVKNKINLYSATQ